MLMKTFKSSGMLHCVDQQTVIDIWWGAGGVVVPLS
jgi:hypothetical protein